ncbi:MAG: hypothetical protein AB7S68_12755 [Polyangiaceae bacterium]
MAAKFGGYALLAGLAGLALAGCGSEGSDSGGTKAPPWEPGTSNVLYGELGESDAELFPSDRYTHEDSTSATGLRVEISPRTVVGSSQLYGFQTSVDELNELDGFSPVGGVVVKFDGPIDYEGYHAEVEGEKLDSDISDAARFSAVGSPLYLVDLTPESPDFGKPLGLVPYYFAQPGDDYWMFDDYTLIAHPAVPLKPRGKYLFLVTQEQKAADGSAIGRSEFMHETLTGQASGDYESLLSEALDTALPSLDLTREQVSAATLFTVGDVQRGMIDLAQARRKAAVPEAQETWSVNDEDTNRVRFVNHYPSPEYRKPKPDGKWEFDPQGVAKKQKDESLEVYLSFSNKTVSGPRPVVIYGHGLGGDKDGVWGTSERLDAISARGVAVFGIDSPEHGSRHEGATTLISSVYGFFGIDEATNEFDIARARDNFRQMAADQLELVRFIQGLSELDVLPVGAPDGVPDLDTSNILYIGHSFGSVQGATIASIAPEIRAVTWNVGGAGLMMLLRDSKTFNIVVKGIAGDGIPFGSVASFMAMTQSIVDPGDPLNFAHYVTQEALPGIPGWVPRDVLLQEVDDDGIVPNSTSDALARAAGLELVHEVRPIPGIPAVSAPVSGNLSGGATGIITQFDRVEGDTKVAEHGGLIFTPEAQDQYVKFFQSVLAGKSQVTSPY